MPLHLPFRRLFPVLNGRQIEASVDEQEAVMSSIAAGETDRDTLTRWPATKTRASED